MGSSLDLVLWAPSGICPEGGGFSYCKFSGIGNEDEEIGHIVG